MSDLEKGRKPAKADEAEAGFLDASPCSKETTRGGGITRRSLCLGVGGVAVAFGLGALKFVPSDPGVRPPGGQDEDRLLSLCIRCQRCYEACPRQVIAPAHLERGILGMRTPELDFSADYCDFCAQENGGVPLCVRACPTQALSLPEGASAEDTLLGVAQINTEWCLAYGAVTCRFCYDACPYDAIELVGGEKMLRPVVVTDRCNGCGACEAACESMSTGSIAAGADARAITVKPLRG